MKTLKLGECYINGDYYPLGVEVSFISGKFWFEGDNIYSLPQSRPHSFCRSAERVVFTR